MDPLKWLRSRPQERVDPSPTSPWWGEHRSRYHFAARWVIGKSVLDVACGTGYGLRILRDAGAGDVVGLDLSIDALESAALEDGDSMIRGDAHALPFRDQSLDVVTSFETIEHLRDGERFVTEVARVLKEGGHLFLSTPNAENTGWDKQDRRNPWHVLEYTPAQLRALLTRNFGDVRMLGQVPRSAFKVTPWDPPGRGIGASMRRNALKVRARLLPFAVNDVAARLLHRRGFYPGEYDFDFDESRVGVSHVLLAHCVK